MATEQQEPDMGSFVFYSALVFGSGFSLGMMAAWLLWR